MGLWFKSYVPKVFGLSAKGVLLWKTVLTSKNLLVNSFHVNTWWPLLEVLELLKPPEIFTQVVWRRPNWSDSSIVMAHMGAAGRKCLDFFESKVQIFFGWIFRQEVASDDHLWKKLRLSQGEADIAEQYDVSNCFQAISSRPKIWPGYGWWRIEGGRIPDRGSCKEFVLHALVKDSPQCREVRVLASKWSCFDKPVYLRCGSVADELQTEWFGFSEQVESSHMLSPFLLL